MPEQLKPFIHIVSKLYLKYGEQYYPTCIIEWDEKTIVQEKIDEKVVSDYVNSHILLISTCRG